MQSERKILQFAKENNLFVTTPEGQAKVRAISRGDTVQVVLKGGAMREFPIDVVANHTKIDVPLDTIKEITKEENEMPDMFSGFLKDIDRRVGEQIAKSVDEQLADIRKDAKSTQTIEVKQGDKVKVIKGLKHKQLGNLIKVAGLRLPILMVGMAGTGKTHAGEQVADALGLKFYAISVGAQTSKSDIIGYMNANGGYTKTLFREAYEKGGVFLMDELDAGNANVLIQINSALSNRQASFPDGMVKMHKDFIFIATANTYGNGLNRQYVGRNQLDSATLDRFTVIDWEIDEALEESLTTNNNWLKAVRACRDYVKEHGIRALVTPRATLKGTQLLGAGVELAEVISATLLTSVPEDKREDIVEVATKVYEG